MIDEKYYTCIKAFITEPCDADTFDLDGGHLNTVKKGSKWYWNPAQPDYLWSADGNDESFICNIDFAEPDPKYFKLTGVHEFEEADK